jgi:hypothetical protein
MRKAQRVFVEAERVHQRERPFEEEKLRHEDMLARTNRLRELRLARETQATIRGSFRTGSGTARSATRFDIPS